MSFVDGPRGGQGGHTGWTREIAQRVQRLLSDVAGLLSITDAEKALAVLPYIYPIGSLYYSTTGIDPATELGFGTWSLFGAGRVQVCIDDGQIEFDTLEETGGEKTHTPTLAETFAHTHSHSHGPGGAGAGGNFVVNIAGGTLGIGAGASYRPASVTDTDATSAGSSTAHNNLQPYIVIACWKRLT